MSRSGFRSRTLLGAALSAVIAIASSGCGASPEGIASDQGALSAPNPARGPDFGPAIAAKDRHADQLLATPGVVGAAVGVATDGQPAVKILTDREDVPGIPKILDGVPVAVEVAGEIVALRGPPADVRATAGRFSTTSVLPRPVPIGVSTGNEGSCSAGTISARLTDGTNVYALSNNHVYALENTAPLGSRVLQPGLYDTACVFDLNNVIGTLSDFQSIDFSTPSNTIDAAIAAVPSTAYLGNATPSNGYGTPSRTPVEAAVNQSVQKYGRSTALTTGIVTMIDATVNVGYDSGVAQFIHQIIVQSNKPFIKPGDSGSLLVDLATPNPHPVGLIFAGTSSGKLAVANRIQDVLTRFNYTSIDGPP